MSREWKPGDVAMVTIGRVESVAFRDRIGWITTARDKVSDHLETCADVEYPARPLVVIDPEDREQAERLAGLLARNGKVHEPFTGAWPDKVQAALRAFTTPPLAEPTGIGAVVEDEAANRWVLVPGEGDDLPEWVCSHSRASWSSVEAVRVLSEGVTA